MGHRGIRSIFLALVVLLVGCAGARRGKFVEWDSVPKSQVVVGRALTSEADGLRVLWNGQVLGYDHDRKQRGFIAGNRAQFAALWIVEATWSRACDGSVVIILPGDTRSCQLDPVIEAIGEFLREQNASDRVVVSMGLRAARAL